MATGLHASDEPNMAVAMCAALESPCMDTGDRAAWASSI